MTIQQFASLIMYDRTYVSQVMKGALKPGKKLAMAIEKATNGEVTAAELLKDKDVKEGE